MTDAAYDLGFADARRHVIAGAFHLPSERPTLAKRVLPPHGINASKQAVADYCRGYADREAAHWRSKP